MTTKEQMTKLGLNYAEEKESYNRLSKEVKEHIISVEAGKINVEDSKRDDAEQNLKHLNEAIASLNKAVIAYNKWIITTNHKMLTSIIKRELDPRDYELLKIIEKKVTFDNVMNDEKLF